MGARVKVTAWDYGMALPSHCCNSWSVASGSDSKSVDADRRRTCSRDPCRSMLGHTSPRPDRCVVVLYNHEDDTSVVSRKNADSLQIQRDV